MNATVIKPLVMGFGSGYHDVVLPGNNHLSFENTYYGEKKICFIRHCDLDANKLFDNPRKSVLNEYYFCAWIKTIKVTDCYLYIRTESLRVFKHKILRIRYKTVVDYENTEESQVATEASQSYVEMMKKEQNDLLSQYDLDELPF